MEILCTLAGLFQQAFNRSWGNLADVRSCFDRTAVSKTLNNANDNFLYDTLNRLTHADYLDAGGNERDGFVYDKLGNRLTLTARGSASSVEYLSNTVNELTKVAATEQMYDEAGNVTKDTAGYTYHYDHLNRLTKVKKANDSVDVAEFGYDALSRRIVAIDYIADGDPETHYYYNDQQVVEEYDWANSTETRLAYYVYGPMYVDEVIVMYNDRAGKDQDYYYAHDMIYSPVTLLSNDGTVAEYYEYDAYGRCNFLDSSSRNFWTIHAVW